MFAVTLISVEPDTQSEMSAGFLFHGSSLVKVSGPVKAAQFVKWKYNILGNTLDFALLGSKASLALAAPFPGWGKGRRRRPCVMAAILTTTPQCRPPEPSVQAPWACPAVRLDRRKHWAPSTGVLRAPRACASWWDALAGIVRTSLACHGGLTASWCTALRSLSEKEKSVQCPAQVKSARRWEYERTLYELWVKMLKCFIITYTYFHFFPLLVGCQTEACSSSWNQWFGQLSIICLNKDKRQMYIKHM